MKKYLIYCRVAATQVEAKKLARVQGDLLKNYAAEKGLVVVGVYTHVGSANDDFDNVLMAMRKKNANCILVTDESRLVRCSSAWAKVTSALHSGEIKEIRTLCNVYLDDPESLILANIVFGFGELSRRDMSERIKRGLAASKQRSCHVAI